MNAHVLTADELLRLVGDLGKPGALTELVVLALCLAGAWLIVRLVRGARVLPGSIWFGERIVDGVLFPLLALVLAFAARRALVGVVPLAVFKIAVPILLSLAVIRLSVRVLRAAFPQSQIVRAIERTISWLAWLAVVLWVTGLLPLVLAELDDIHISVGTVKLTVRNVIEGTLSAGLVLVVTLWLSAAIEAKLMRDATGEDLSMRKIAANATRAVLLFIGLLIALSAVGIDLTALSVLGGAIGVGLGLGLQKLAANYVSGFVILAERSLRIGDLVKVDNFEGRITDIKTRYTVIRSQSGRESIVPNEMLITERVENASLADPNLLLTTVVSVGYDTDLDALRPRLVEAVAAVPRVVSEPRPGVLLTNFGADGLELTVTFWIGDPEKSQLAARSEVNLAILRLLRDEGVEIPFPQRVVHAPAGAASAAQPPVLRAADAAPASTSGRSAA